MRNIFPSRKLLLREALEMDHDSIEGVDRISDLPDHILCHILSFLPTKYAVGTSVLSTRWKYLWTCVPILDFDDRLYGDLYAIANQNLRESPNITFKNFVNRVMLLNDISHIKKFRLIYVHHNTHTPISTWLQLAISHHIQELELDFYMFSQKDYVKLPRNVFISNSLVVLKLSRLPLSVPSFVSFPMLKTLELRCVLGLDDKCVQNLLSGCQVLEELVIEEFTREKPRVININSHTLKSFFFSYRYVVDITVDLPYNFIINAPNLEFFHIKGRISDCFLVKSLANLVNAHLDLRKTGVLHEAYDNCHQQVCNLIEGIKNAKFLSISNDIVQLFCASLEVNLPVFSNLTKLAIGIGVDFSWKRLIIKFIKCSPGLEILTLNNKQGLVRDIEQWLKNRPLPVRNFQLLQVKKIILQELYSNFQLEAVNAVECLLEDVNILKRLKINCQCPYMLKNQIGYAMC